jgi:hypothetical protein
LARLLLTAALLTQLRLGLVEQFTVLDQVVLLVALEAILPFPHCLHWVVEEVVVEPQIQQVE